MITDIYAHILDEDRKVNAQKFDAAFYSNPDMREVEKNMHSQTISSSPDDLLKQLESTPDLMNAFTQKFVEQYGSAIMSQLAKQMSST